MRLAILASHPIQYQAPIFRLLAGRVNLTVFYAHRANQTDQATAGFGVGFDWDIDLLSGYEHEFMDNVSRNPGLDHFGGCDTPSIQTKLADGNYTVHWAKGIQQSLRPMKQNRLRCSMVKFLTACAGWITPSG